MKSPDSAQGPAGLYIHVPFCPRVCPYCDFAVLKAPVRMHRTWLDLIIDEWEIRSKEFENFQTLYLGGGTPSLLDDNVFKDLISFLQDVLFWGGLNEISMEANPETLNSDKIDLWQKSGISRLTLGIQSFQPQFLQWLGRNHGIETLDQSRELLLSRSFSLGLDLIFGLPNQTWKQLELDLIQGMKFDPEHISLYGLCIEENTLFGQRASKGEEMSNESAYDDLYIKAVNWLEKEGFERYELSNFARNGKISIHNRNYWQHKPYLGLGPGAHSLLDRRRFWNSKSFAQWQKSIHESSSCGFEELSQENWLNEWIWLSLRQAQGLNMQFLNSTQKKRCLEFAKKGLLVLNNNHWVIPTSQSHQMDLISSELMLEA